MAVKDKIHDIVKNALIKDGWRITDDPLTIEYEDARVFIDLGAERVLAAERDNEKIAVEIKTFAGRSAIHAMEIALGQLLIKYNQVPLIVVETNQEEIIAWIKN